MRISRKTISCSIVVACFIVSCSPSEQQIQTAIAATQAAAPPTATATIEPTATPKPVTGADLEPLLFQPGDFTVSGDGAQFSSEVPDYWGDPVLYRRLRFSDNEMIDVRGVEVALYDHPISEDVFFAVGGMSGETVDGLGDASGLSTATRNLSKVTVAWRRCDYLASINVRVGTNYNFDQAPVVEYARRLDERLTKLFCP